MTVPVLITALVLAPLPLRAPVHPAPPAAWTDQAARSDRIADRLRPQGARVQFWLREAQRRSATVRRLVGRIGDSDVIVYLDVSRELSPNVSACLTWMAATSTQRFVRASFRIDLPLNEAIAMLAHELQHVVEVIEHPEVTSTQTLLDLYTRIGHATARTGIHWDTADAVAVGALARLEALTGPPPSRADLRKGT